MRAQASRECEYLGYQVTVNAGRELKRMRTLAAAWIHDADDQQICRHTEFVGWGARGWPRDDQEACEKLAEQAFHRARGAVLLGRVNELDGREIPVAEESHYADRSDAYLRPRVLQGFKRAFDHDPPRAGRIDFDDVGVSLVEEVEPKRIVNVLVRLQGDGLIEQPGVRQDPGYRFYKPTPAGLTEAERVGKPSPTPGVLVEETVATVEGVLTKHSPELAAALRRQSVRVAEASQMTEHEVGEVAHACEQIIWDFLDLDVVWEGVAEERPPKQKTRDRVRLLVRAKAPSETEQEVLEALAQYIAEWFGRLEQFIHKHRHVPGESERGHAKRFVVYTYMLLGDLIEVFDL